MDVHLLQVTGEAAANTERSKLLQQLSMSRQKAAWQHKVAEEQLASQKGVSEAEVAVESVRGLTGRLATAIGVKQSN